MTNLKDAEKFDEKAVADAMEANYEKWQPSSPTPLGIAVTAGYEMARWQHEQLAPVIADLKADNQILKEALEKIVAKSHSWIITFENGFIEKPIHDMYRDIANQAIVTSTQKSRQP